MFEGVEIAMAIAWRLASSTAVISVRAPGAGEFSSLISVPAVCGALPMMSFFSCGVMGAGPGVVVIWGNPKRFSMYLRNFALFMMSFPAMASPVSASLR